MTDVEHVDILNLIGIDHITFNNSGQDITIDDGEQQARVFRKGGKVVYRAGSHLWDEDLPRS